MPILCAFGLHRFKLKQSSYLHGLTLRREFFLECQGCGADGGGAIIEQRPCKMGQHEFMKVSGRPPGLFDLESHVGELGFVERSVSVCKFCGVRQDS